MGKPTTPDKTDGENSNLMLIANILTVLGVIAGIVGLLATFKVITNVNPQGCLLIGITGLTLIALSHLIDRHVKSQR